jgi:hypothetical protein
MTQVVSRRPYREGPSLFPGKYVRFIVGGGGSDRRQGSPSFSWIIPSMLHIQSLVYYWGYTVLAWQTC